MNLLNIGPYVFNTSLTWYSVFVLTGALLTYVITEFLYKKDPESKKCPDLILNTFLIAFPAGLVGARIWYVLSEWKYYYSDPINILKVWEGGLAIQGGVMLGAMVGIFYVYHTIRRFGLNLKVTKIMDMAIPNILIAQVVGRWGNFFNREVYGACVDHLYALKNWWMLPNWLVEYMRGGVVSGLYVSCPVTKYAQPLFLYEGILNFIGFVLISIVVRKFFTKRVDGTLNGLYLIWYGSVRACLEGLRNEEFIMRWGNLSQSMITSIFFIFVGFAYISYLYTNHFLNKQKLIELNEIKVENKEVSNPNEVVEVSEKKVDNQGKKTSRTSKTTSTRKNIGDKK